MTTIAILEACACILIIKTEIVPIDMRKVSFQQQCRTHNTPQESIDHARLFSNDESGQRLERDKPQFQKR